MVKEPDLDLQLEGLPVDAKSDIGVNLKKRWTSPKCIYLADECAVCHLYGGVSLPPCYVLIFV